MMRNPYFEKMTGAFQRSRVENPMLKAAVTHHDKQKEIHKRHLHLLAQTFARTRRHAMIGDYKEVQNAYKDYVTHSKKLMKQSMNHFSQFSQETQPKLHKHWKNYTDFSRKAAKETLTAGKKVADAITPKSVKKTAKAISSLAPVKAAQSVAKKTTAKIARKASALSKTAPKGTRSLSSLTSSTSAKSNKSLKISPKSSGSKGTRSLSSLTSGTSAKSNKSLKVSSKSSGKARTTTSRARSR